MAVIEVTLDSFEVKNISASQVHFPLSFVCSVNVNNDDPEKATKARPAINTNTRIQGKVRAAENIGAVMKIR